MHACMRACAAASCMHARMPHVPRAHAQGPAVWALRAQTDKLHYSTAMRSVLENEPNLYIREGMAVDVEVRGLGGGAAAEQSREGQRVAKNLQEQEGICLEGEKGGRDWERAGRGGGRRGLLMAGGPSGAPQHASVHACI